MVLILSYVLTSHLITISKVSKTIPNHTDIGTIFAWIISGNNYGSTYIMAVKGCKKIIQSFFLVLSSGYLEIQWGRVFLFHPTSYNIFGWVYFEASTICKQSGYNHDAGDTWHFDHYDITLSDSHFCKLLFILRGFQNYDERDIGLGKATISYLYIGFCTLCLRYYCCVEFTSRT